MKKLLLVLLAVTLLIGLGGCGNSSQTASKPDKIIMGFVPSVDSDKIADTIKPLADELAKELGMPVEGKVMTNYSALVEAMGSNKVQIGFLPAFGYVLANQKHGVQVILKSERYGSDYYHSQWVVRADSGINSLADLKGKTWAIPDLTSTSGFLFPAAQIMDQFQVKDVQAEFFGKSIQAGGHDNALIAVLEGNADVATTFDDARTIIKKDHPDVMDKLKVIGYSKNIPNDTISVTKELDKDLVAKIKNIFLSFNDKPDMIKIMHDVYSWDAIRAAKDSDYDVVRSTYNKFKDSIKLD